MIITDDQGWADIGYNNQGGVYTPNLDKLAGEGAVLTSHYVMPQCTPTRVAAFTGRYPSRFGGAALKASNAPSFPIGTPTIARMLKSAGYNTYLTGKWHMGSAAAHGPNHHGFDSSYGSLAGAVGMYDHRYRKGPYYDAWHRDHKLISGSENGQHATDLIANEAVRIIKQDNDKPYFIMATFHAPHTPLDERGPFIEQPTKLDPADPSRWINEDKISWFNDPKGIIQKEKDPEKRLLLAAVNHVDHAIGQIMQAIDKSGEKENTVVFFSSDNGPQGSWGGRRVP
jgi:arylsulfatase A-like enzyme